MNKYQESLDRIEETYYNLDNCLSAMKRFSKDVEVLRELVDKETPMKVVKYRPLENDVKIGNVTLKKGISFLKVCPVCGKWVHPRYHNNYCGNCGGRLDWSEEE